MHFWKRSRKDATPPSTSLSMPSLLAPQTRPRTTDRSALSRDADNEDPPKFSAFDIEQCHEEYRTRFIFEQATSPTQHEALTTFLEKYIEGKINLSRPPIPPTLRFSRLFLPAPCAPTSNELARVSIVQPLMNMRDNLKELCRENDVNFRFKEASKVGVAIGLPRVAISVIGWRQEMFLAGSLHSESTTETPAILPCHSSLASHAILSTRTFEICNLEKDWRFAAYSLFSPANNIEYYVAQPLAVFGVVVGVLAFAHESARAPVTDARKLALEHLADRISDALTKLYKNCLPDLYNSLSRDNRITLQGGPEHSPPYCGSHLSLISPSQPSLHEVQARERMGCLPLPSAQLRGNTLSDTAMDKTPSSERGKSRVPIRQDGNDISSFPNPASETQMDDHSPPETWSSDVPPPIPARSPLRPPPIPARSPLRPPPVPITPNLTVTKHRHCVNNSQADSDNTECSEYGPSAAANAHNSALTVKPDFTQMIQPPPSPQDNRSLSVHSPVLPNQALRVHRKLGSKSKEMAFAVQRVTQYLRFSYLFLIELCSKSTPVTEIDLVQTDRWNIQSLAAFGLGPENYEERFNIASEDALSLLSSIHATGNMNTSVKDFSKTILPYKVFASRGFHIESSKSSDLIGSNKGYPLPSRLTPCNSRESAMTPLPQAPPRSTTSMNIFGTRTSAQSPQVVFNVTNPLSATPSLVGQFFTSNTDNSLLRRTSEGRGPVSVATSPSQTKSVRQTQAHDARFKKKLRTVTSRIFKKTPADTQKEAVPAGPALPPLKLPSTELNSEEIEAIPLPQEHVSNRLRGRGERIPASLLAAAKKTPGRAQRVWSHSQSGAPIGTPPKLSDNNFLGLKSLQRREPLRQTSAPDLRRRKQDPMYDVSLDLENVPMMPGLPSQFQPLPILAGAHTSPAIPLPAISQSGPAPSPGNAAKGSSATPKRRLSVKGQRSLCNLRGKPKLTIDIPKPYIIDPKPARGPLNLSLVAGGVILCAYRTKPLTETQFDDYRDQNHARETWRAARMLGNLSDNFEGIKARFPMNRLYAECERRWPDVFGE